MNRSIWSLPADESLEGLLETSLTRVGSAVLFAPGDAGRVPPEGSRARGRRREGIALLRAAIDVARSGGHVAAEIRALANLGANTEDPSRSREVGLEAFNLAVRVGNVNLARWARESVRFSTFLLAENWDEALGQTWEEADQALGGSAALSDEARWIATTATMLIARAQPVAPPRGRRAAASAGAGAP